MDFLDPKKQRQHRLMLLIGYSMVTIGVAIGSVILLWQAYGYSVKNGKVIQDGMIFVSSQPNPAKIYINGQLNSATTNTRLTIPSGVYTFELKANGYRPWSHTIALLGGMVIHYDYPFLFPTSLTSKSIATFASAPQLASQSPSQQYLVVSDPTNADSFLMYDLTKPTAAPITLPLPAGVASAAVSSQSWSAVGWADDNQHLLLAHTYDGNQEFIELNTKNPAQSININKTFSVDPTSVTLDNLKYNQFYFYSSSTQALSTATIGSPTVTSLVNGVLAYKSYLSNTVLYATSVGAPAGEVAIEMNVSGTNYLLRYLPQASTYLLDEASYSGDDYVVAGDSASNLVYVYENPLNQVTNPSSKIIPFLAMSISDPNYESFAPTAQFILVENGTNFDVYDIYNNILYHYSSGPAMEAPQQHAEWMDGDRLVYVSGGQLTVADYDNTNRQTLNSSLPDYSTFFAPNYHSYFTMNQSGANTLLDQTSLIAP